MASLSLLEQLEERKKKGEEQKEVEYIGVSKEEKKICYIHVRRLEPSALCLLIRGKYFILAIYLYIQLI